MFILGTSFSESSHTIAKKYKVQLHRPTFKMR